MQLNLLDQHLSTLMLSTCRYRNGVMIANCSYETLSDVEDLATGGGGHPTEFEYGLTDDDDIPAAYGGTVAEAMSNLEAKYARMEAAGQEPGNFANVLEALETACGDDWKPLYEQLVLEQREWLERRERSNREHIAGPALTVRMELPDMSADDLRLAFFGPDVRKSAN
ncbi:MAG: hypothetical protein M3Y65_24965 [Pseudomonadota bacterium]|nr:hypothetical protein [Pseudomonadota bacterium]